MIWLVVESVTGYRLNVFFSSATFISPPTEFVTAMFGACCNVQSSIAVEVRNDDLICTSPVVLQRVLRPLAGGIAVVLEPDNAARISPGCCGDIDIAVPVQIPRRRFEGIIESCLDEVLFPRPHRGCAVVFILDNLIVFPLVRSMGIVGIRFEIEPQRHHDIQVTIAVHVGRIAVCRKG